ncbi:MAG TPA: hypothetical protein VES97_02540 [Solirubrobacteraceae bacterium]|nr:hypothetical protein [Solirubrobacteraceae bacterium]HYM66445.1 hypothetical protein [Patescibacteria group bacterium]
MRESSGGPGQTAADQAAEGLCLVHLVWAPLGPEALGRFVESYRRYRTGVEHRLLILLNGFRAGHDLTPWRQKLEGVEHEELLLTRPMLDLGAYRQAAEVAPAGRYCFVNSFSLIVQDDWLGALDRHLLSPGVGIVGTGGSYESAYSSAPRPLRPFRRDFDPFPNPHIRTNGFALRRELLLSLDWPAPRRKLDAWRLESGRRGISRQVRERGLSLLVVGRDGAAYQQERWRESATFRSGGQVNRLVADNRTLEYETVNPRRRLQLERLAWGTAG